MCDIVQEENKASRIYSGYGSGFKVVQIANSNQLEYTLMPQLLAIKHESKTKYALAINQLLDYYTSS